MAQTLLEEVPRFIGKKKIIGRQLPFDVFVGRKLQKWQARAKDFKVDLVDAVGVSPLSEMCYFWNGYKRMAPENLEKSLVRIQWSESVLNDGKEGVPSWENEDLDERGIHAVLKATVLRNLGRTAEARELIEKNVLAHDKTLFKGGFKDNWVPPCANYEMGVSYWNDYEASGEKDVENLGDSLKYLDVVSAWESFDLDTRLGVRIKTGQNTVKSTKERLDA
jgi:hypothetical protein